MSQTVREPEREIPVMATTDVVVCGGGGAGMCAALAARQLGASVLLVEYGGCLGGLATAGLVTHLHGFKSWVEPYELAVGGIPLRFVQEMQAQGGVNEPEDIHAEPFHHIAFDPEIFKRIAEEWVAEAGVDLLYYTKAVDVLMKGTRVVGIVVENKSGRGAILAGVVIDCTGDADIAAWAGVPYEKSSVLQPMTLQFRLGGVHGGPETDALNEHQQQVMLKAYEDGRLPMFGGPWFLKIREGEFTINATRMIGDSTIAKDLTQTTLQGRKDAWSLFHFFKDNFEDFASSYMLDTAWQVGSRESRRIRGEYTLTLEDIRVLREFDDSVAHGCFWIDQHPSDGSVGIHTGPAYGSYDIPYRCLVPQKIDSLLVAGRSISANRNAQATVRVMGTAMALGQAAGTAAALCVSSECPPREVEVADVQQTLSDTGAIF